MKYMGSKNRIAKDIIKLTQRDRKHGQWYVEPFVGGANMIDKVHGNCVGYDANEHTIEALKWIRDDVKSLPRNNAQFTEKDYHAVKRNKDRDCPALVGYTGFALSYSGKWFGGWCRDGAGKRDYVAEAYRNAVKQSPKLQHIGFFHKRYQDLELPHESIVYCDPPYESSTSYKDDFDHVEFWQWCRDRSNEGHVVYISEYNAPDDFKCIWEKEIVSSLTKETGSKKGVERLFIYEPE